MPELSHRFEQTRFSPFWAETVADKPVLPVLSESIDCDLAIIGAGFTGLWSALKARERHPDARIVVLEARHLADAASGRNGGFCAPSISHGVGNALNRWPDEAEKLVRLGRENLDAMEADIATYGIDAEFERTGKLNVARTAWEADGLGVMQSGYANFGIETAILTPSELASHLESPRYPTGLFEANYAYVNPAKLVHGLAQACLSRGVAIFQDSRVTGLQDMGEILSLATDGGEVLARQVVMATNADVPLLSHLRRAIIPVYDYTIMSEPLTDTQLQEIGWQGRHGIADSGNQFHYSRKTADNRILWGGYDAIYHYGSRRDPDLLHRNETYAGLEATFLDTFPSLKDVRFSHAWGGIIDTSARLTFFTGTAYGGRLTYAMGFTGQGVTASRFAALSMLDHLKDLRTERTELRMTQSQPVAFPPEPLRSLGIRWAQADLAREDRTGHRSLMLCAMDKIGIGFGS
ncbi:FAD-dependent oxidoreductase [uncultured Shimia sp.]|uniref:NAD(P)/FAD-dependent oxidoreductase n=1 Tax=uncultured Shimia sp. TaxID=573152 RepID=UPI0026395DA4|nr:FAD-dependent oxidoreductase [uncultured Shimia sp.]